MITLSLLLMLGAPSQAQTAPAESPAAVGQLQSADPAVSGAKLDDLFKRFTSGSPMIPTLKEVQAENLRRALAPRPGEFKASILLPMDPALRGPGPIPDSPRRTTTENVDVSVSRPLPRVELGVGFGAQRVYAGNGPYEDDKSAYASVRIDLSKNILGRKLFHMPTAVHTKTKIGDSDAQVSSGEYSIDTLRKP